MAEEKYFQVQFQPVGKRVKVLQGTTVLEAARQAGIELTTACGGNGSCGQCQVVLVEGCLSPVKPNEKFLITEEDLQRGYRLACGAQILSDVRLHLPKESMLTGQRLQVESSLKTFPPDPFIDAVDVQLEPAALQDLRSDLTRLRDALHAQGVKDEVTASSALVRSLPDTLRENDWKVTAYLRRGEILAVRPHGEKPLGYAVDLGTTKIAAHLVDLCTGEVLGSAGAPNPQISYGEDVISRLNYAVRSPEGGRVLAGKVREALNGMLGDLLRQAGARREQVVDGCVVANTAMSHLLLKFPVKQLAKSPYVAAASEALDVPAAELDLDMAPGARVHIPPIIGGFVGSDHVAMLLACELDESSKVTIGLDIGTNTEISLRIPGSDHLTSVSCASGPAFEGAHIRDGMRAASGAIEKVRIENGRLTLTTIDHEPPVGLCGSGILDAVAELYRAGYLNKNGRFQRERPEVQEGEQGPEFVLVPAQESGSGREIVITQNDVNEIQLAKGAIHAGLKVLLEATGTPPEAVQEVIVAGAFGSFINIQSAVAIGLFPDLPRARYRQVGNAAAVGARWILISRAARQRAQEIARRAHYLELTIEPGFSRQFARGMLFPA